jgi:hypothetical protein
MIPIYELIINEDPNSDKMVSAISLVDAPAIGEKFMLFKEQEKQINYAMVDEAEGIVIGAALIPNQQIYRKDPDGKEYYVFMTEKTIQQIAVKFFEKNNHHNGNEQHDPNKPVEVVFYQSWIADETKGVPKLKGFEHLPNGTWFIGGVVKDEEVKKKIKEGTYQGFSIEGSFFMKQSENEIDDVINEIKKLVKDY